jgi:hypothetical protein
MITGLVGGGGMGVPAFLPSVQTSAANAVLHAAGLAAPNDGPQSWQIPAAVLPEIRISPEAVDVPAEAAPMAANSIAAVRDSLRVGPDHKRVSYELAFNQIAENNARTTAELERMHDLTRAQGKGWYRASVTAAGAGMCVVAVAVIVLILGQLTTGIVTTVASIVPNVLASMFFVNSRRADERVDALTKRLTGFRQAAAMVDIAQTIENEKLRDGVKAEIVRKMLANPS